MKLNDASYEIFRDINLKNMELLLTSGTGKHFHHQMEILCVSDGEITVSINNEERLLTRGHIAIADSYDTHAYDIHGKATGHVLIISKGFVSDYTAATRNLVLAENFISYKPAFDKIEKLILLLKDTDQENVLFNKGIVTAVMGIIRETLKYKARAIGDKSHIMRDILNYLYEHADENITLESVSRNFGYTPNHFSSIFNSFTGAGLKEYLNTIRAENAAALISSGINVSEAAMNTGFDSLRTFYRAFSKHFNIPPGKYSKLSLKEKKDSGNSAG